MTVPPPPYSPKSLDAISRTQAASTQDTPPQGSNFCTRGTLSSTASTLSVEGPIASRSSRPRPVSMIHPSEINNPYRQSGYFPLPPPPKSNRSSHPSSHIPTDRPQNTSHLLAPAPRNRDTSGPVLPNSI